MKDTIITISRAYGSGGHKIGESLAGRSGLSKEIMKDAESILITNILFSPSRLGPSAEVYGMSLGERIFLSNPRRFGNWLPRGSCVMIGRCAD